MSNNLDDDMLNDFEGYNWEINTLEDLTQSDCDHDCSSIPDLDIKIKIDKVNLTKEKETHNEPDPLTSKAAMGLRRTSQIVLNPQQLKD